MMRSSRPMRVGRYLARLGVGERPVATPEALRLLHESHLLRVPFENLDIHRGVEILLDEDRILEKIVESRRGGFCYELNSAFAWLLQQLGFEVELLSAEVADESGEGFGIPFDHMTLRVILDRSYLADVGFGDGFRRPLPMESEREVEQMGHVYRLRRRGRWWFLDRQTVGSAHFRTQYRFTLEPRKLDDFSSGCRHHQTSPDSSFTRKAICSLALEDGRVTLHRDRLVWRRDGKTTEVPISDRAAWEGALERHFGIRL